MAQATLERLIRRFGEQPARVWWDGLDERLASLAALWDVTLGDSVGRGNTSLVVRCERAGDGRAGVLKLCPEAALADAEAEVLGIWASSGRVPSVWAHEGDALLLEAIGDGTPLSLDPAADVAVDDIGALIGDLRAAAAEPPPGVPTLADRVTFAFTFWLARRAAEPPIAEAVSVAALEAGGAAALELATDGCVPAVLLHGDLHPGNVLDGGVDRGLVAIDPRACAGDPAFDAIDWVSWRAAPAERDQRLVTLATAADADPERLRAWCVAFAPMLAASEAARPRVT